MTRSTKARQSHLGRTRRSWRFYESSTPAFVDAEGYGWLDPAGSTGAIHFSDDEYRVFYISNLLREDVQKLCNALGLNAFDGQAMELIQPE